ncbi:solute carrier family 2, facilitated glucose transporter member 8-like isoform X1 [Dermacentor albipictus]|uniref:solute carrier family 2, facilitated glucose transporter member 8-like isoform X1 n=1 Tax=Dermacentor albipictus TaxID=60249 RepID=UPI0031FE15D5
MRKGTPYVIGDTTVISHQDKQSRLSEKVRRGSTMDFVRMLETELAAKSAAPDLPGIWGLTAAHCGKGVMPYMSLVPCWAGSLCIGTALGYALPAGRTLDDAAHRGSLDVPHRQILWFGSMMSLGAVFGSLAGAMLTQLNGRRCSLSIAAVGLLASWLVIGWARNIYYYCGSRFLGGLLTGVVSVIVPAHIAEMAPVTRRGMHGALHQFAVTLGVLYAYCFGRSLDWDWLAVSCAPPAAALLVLTRTFAVESPRWILQKGDTMGSLKALITVRGSKSLADIEFDAIQEVLPKYRTPVAHYFLALLVVVSQQLSGINSVILSTVCLDHGADSTRPSMDSTIALALLQTLATLLVVPFVDSAGRRNLLGVSVVACWGSMVSLGFIYFSSRPDRAAVVDEWKATSPADLEVEEATSAVASASGVNSMLTFALKALFVVAFSAGLGPVPWILAAELVPLRGTGLEFGSVCAASWTGVFVTANFVATTDTARMFAVSLWLYGLIALTGGLISFMLLPKTDCMSIEDILLIDPDDRARTRKIRFKSKEHVFATPGSGGHATTSERTATVAKPPIPEKPHPGIDETSLKSLTPDKRSSDITQATSKDLTAEKPQSAVSPSPTEALTTEKVDSDVSQGPSKGSDKKLVAVSEQQLRDHDRRKSSVASQKLIASEASADSARSKDSTRKK